MFTWQSDVRKSGHVVSMFTWQSDVRKSGHVPLLFTQASEVRKQFKATNYNLLLLNII